ncbi:hypothetical protein C0Q70_05457 [Pomacea canaliculata]|uniref:THSD1 third Ig-like domain-containing protein n=1 Tax=Pomacea canaliculata TaxID=400727 RepID=A0A2T7PL85_POMCA|nr:hypothetical protein C0Q70_05457 [Pomacea canaliculata]
MQRHIEVTYTQPSCAGAGGKIRLFSLHRSPGSLAAPLQHRYVTEQVVHPDKNTLAFSCSHLNQTVTGYCFVYVTVARLGAVVPQRELCLPFHADAGTATYVTNSTSSRRWRLERVDRVECVLRDVRRGIAQSFPHVQRAAPQARRVFL